MNTVEGQSQLLGCTGNKDADQVLAHLRAAGTDFGAAIGIDLDLGFGLVGRAASQPRILIARCQPPGIAFAANLKGRKEIGGWLHLGRTLHLGQFLAPPALDRAFDLAQTVEQAHALAQMLPRGGHRAHAHGIDAPQLDGIHAQFMCQQIHIALDRKGRLRHAKTAECATGGVVGIHRIAINPGVGHDIGASGVGRRPCHHLLAQAGIGPAVAI